jgi:hypothetical protein
MKDISEDIYNSKHSWAKLVHDRKEVILWSAVAHDRLQYTVSLGHEVGSLVSFESLMHDIHALSRMRAHNSSS